jgi:hypothetical protein
MPNTNSSHIIFVANASFVRGEDRVKVRRVVDSDSSEVDKALTAEIREEFGVEGYVYVRIDRVYGVDDITKASETHFFDADSMRFFKSRVYESQVVGHRVYFLTSEKCDYTDPRLYSVRYWDAETDMIDTVGEFQEHKTLATARRALARHLAA